MPALDPQIARILEKLARAHEQQIETFGLRAHGYELSPPLSAGEVAALEARLGIELPEAYRAFLCQAGASGAGPYYGMLPPERWGDALYGDVAMPDFAARPCVWSTDTPRDEATWTARTADLAEPFHGAIAIADQGCANYATLVTAGPERGRVMYVSLDGGVPFFPENPDFLSWYERWLDELLWGFEHLWFGTQMPGDEAALAAAARPADGPRRLDALGAMHQLPRLAPETRAVVAARVRDADPRVRSAALQLLKAHPLAAWIDDEVRRAIDDDAAEVRLAALEALVAADLSWHDEARRALSDADEQVAVRALRALHEVGAIDDETLLPLLSAASRRLRDAAVNAARTVPSPRLFDALLAIAREGNEPPAVLAVLGQVRLGDLDQSRRDAALDLVLLRLATATGLEAPTAEIHGLHPFVATHPRALEALIDLTRHPEPFFRFTAATALGEVGDADALPALRALSSDETMPKTPNTSASWSVGENARRAIARIEASLAKRS